MAGHGLWSFRCKNSLFWHRVPNSSWSLSLKKCKKCLIITNRFANKFGTWLIFSLILTLYPAMLHGIVLVGVISLMVGYKFWDVCRKWIENKQFQNLWNREAYRLQSWQTPAYRPTFVRIQEIRWIPSLDISTMHGRRAPPLELCSSLKSRFPF